VIGGSKRGDRNFAARYGGEELVLLLPYNDLKGAEKVAKELIQKIEQCNIVSALGASHPMVTISVGVSAYSPSYKERAISNPTELIDKADIHLFKAKQAVRNRYSA
jgi:diguanylate cyclase (GGDEF)-like protein